MFCNRMHQHPHTSACTAQHLILLAGCCEDAIEGECEELLLVINIPVMSVMS